MSTQKYISFLLNGMLIFTMVFIFFDELTSFEIKNQAIKSFVYYGILAITPLTLIWGISSFGTRKWKIIRSVLPTFILAGILIIGPFDIVLSSRAWNTQNVLYQHRNATFRKIEFQMQDVGGLGYNNRTVEVRYLTDLFMIITPIEKDSYDETEWVRVDEETNELRLKFP